MTQKYYRGYILFRLAKIGTEWKVVEKMMQMKSEDNGKAWKVTYCTPIYGAWDLLAEVSFTQLEHLDNVVSKIRMDPEVNDFIEETTTLVSCKPNYSLD
ncbi:MAG: hypothetical protein ACTSRZ_01475 [Promethearchaeota archaeon]